jgi:ORF6N domain-containing protein
MAEEQKFSDALAVQVERRIFLVRGQKVMLDTDLAELYRVPTKSLNLAVKRNADRFPDDFMFQLTDDEAAGLRFHFETSKRGRGGRRYLSYAFTEQGVAMLSSVLRSSRAVQVNIAIMRTFVRLREMLLSNAELARKLAALENKYDAQYGMRGRCWIDCIGCMVRQPSGREIASQFKVVFDAIRELMLPPSPPKRQIGFHVRERATRGYRVRRRK